MDLKNKKIINTSDSFTNAFKEKIKLRVSDRFDPSIIGKIDLFEAEEIAKEEGLFLTENDIMEGLEDFELVPIKSGREFKTEITQEASSGLESMNLAALKDNSIDSNKNLEAIIGKSHMSGDSLSPPIDSVPKVEPIVESQELDTIDEILDSEIIIFEEVKTALEDKTGKEDFTEAISDSADSFVTELEQTDQVSESSTDIEKIDLDSVPDDLKIETPVDIDEADILSNEVEAPVDIDEVFPEEIKVLYDDQIRIIEELEDRELLLLDEKTFIKEIGDGADFDSFASEKYQSMSEISEILGLAPEEKDYINEKLFGEYYKKSSYNVELGRADAGVVKDESRLIDITDDIVILEDKEKLLEFTSEFIGKGDHLVKLLSYLDGLFEKLPEDVIRKFAESEYFDLYTKILKDMEL